jgi:hypothetical protein
MNMKTNYDITLTNRAASLADTFLSKVPRRGGGTAFDHAHDVATRVRAGGASPEAVVVGYLHDVLEDTDLTAQDLRDRGFGDEVVSAVELLTHGRHERYADYAVRVAQNPLARRVKRADIASNLAGDPSAHAVRKYADALEAFDQAEAAEIRAHATSHAYDSFRGWEGKLEDVPRKAADERWETWLGERAERGTLAHAWGLRNCMSPEAGPCRESDSHEDWKVAYGEQLLEVADLDDPTPFLRGEVLLLVDNDNWERCDRVVRRVVDPSPGDIRDPIPAAPREQAHPLHRVPAAIARMRTKILLLLLLGGCARKPSAPFFDDWRIGPQPATIIVPLGIDDDLATLRLLGIVEQKTTTNK